MARNLIVGEIRVYCGPMGSEKSLQLIMEIYRASHAKKVVMAFVPSICESSFIESRFGVKHAAIKIDNLNETISLALDGGADLVVIDEAQFFKDSNPDVLYGLSEACIDVVIAGLDRAYDGSPFGIMPEILAIADEVVKCKSVCVDCGSPATMTKRIVQGDSTIVLDKDQYAPKCRDCWFQD